MERLHTYHDGSVLYRMSARALCHIPIWKGNRIVDSDHVQTLKETVGNVIDLDSGYRLVCYEEEEKGGMVKRSYVVDGQHRIRILSEVLRENPDVDFVVTVTEIELPSEEEVIRYFNQINHSKPLQYKEDPHLTVNRYLEGVMRAYARPVRLIRSGTTRRPYLSLDRFRQVLLKHIDLLRKRTVEEFVEMCDEENQRMIEQLSQGDDALRRKTVECGFALAWDDKFKWVEDGLRREKIGGA